MGERETATAKRIADAVNKSKTFIKIEATKNGWPYMDGDRLTRHYYIDSIPVEYRIALSARAADYPPEIPSQVVVRRPALFSGAMNRAATALQGAALSIQGSSTLRDWQRVKALAWADLIRLYMAHAKNKGSHGSRVQAKRDFVMAYNAGAYPVLFETLGSTSFKTLERQTVKIRKGADPVTALAPRYGGSKGKRCIGPDQAAVLLSIVRSPFQPKKKSEIIRIARAVMDQKGVQDGASDDTYRRFLDDWISVNYDQWIFWREGEKGLNEKCLFWLKRDYNKIDVGDILVADGHTLNFETLNPWTGKAKRMTLILWFDMKSNYPCGWEIMPTENTQAINAALRRAIIMLGKRPRIAYLDNGAAFSSRFFNGVNLEEAGFSGVYDRLGIQPVFAWPYHPQSKPVERFFGSFAELERIAPSYVGTSIAEKPPRLNMGEKTHRRICEKITGGRIPTLEETHRAVAAWFDEYARRPQQDGHLKGIRPIDVFLPGRGSGVDQAELHELMMSIEVRTIRRRGIRLLGEWYYHPSLYGRKHSVTIRYDLQNPQSILVYRDQEFICEATRMNDVHPMAWHMGTAEDKAELADQLDLKGGLKKQTLTSARELLNTVVIPETTRQIESAGFTLEGPKQEDSKKKAEVIHLTDDAKARIQEDFEALEKAHDEMGLGRIKWDEISRLTDMERYEKDLELDAQGVLIPRDEQAFMSYFEQTIQFGKYSDYFENTRVKYAVMYQTN